MKLRMLLILSAVMLVAADAPKELQGVWVVTKMEEGGKVDEKAVGDTITIEGEKFKIWSKEEKKEVASGKFNFDPAKKPAEVDMTLAGPDGKEATMNGLYQPRRRHDQILFRAQARQGPAQGNCRQGRYRAGHPQEGKEVTPLSAGKRVVFRQSTLRIRR